MTKLGEYCFDYCKSLQSITIPDSVTKLGICCFSDCKSLQSITISNSVTELDDYCFYENSSLESISIPNSVTKLGECCFSSCISLKSIIIPNSVNEIDRSCFLGYTSLESVVISNSVTKLGNSCFAACKSLKYITIPNSVTKLGICCFESCSSLESITIPNSVTKIGNNCFEECNSLTEIKYRDIIFTKYEIDDAIKYSIQNYITFPEAIKKLWPEFSDAVFKTTIWYGHLAGVILGILFMLTRKQYNKKEIFKIKQSMSLKEFMIIIPIMFSAQLPSIINDYGTTEILKIYNLQQTDLSELMNNIGLAMIMYIVIIGPLIEEIMYHGFILFKLEENGKRYAYIISSVIFGLMHGNLTQIPFAILAGLVLGYIAQKYGLIYSYIFHVLNNAMSCSYSAFLTSFGDAEQLIDGIYYSISIINFVLGVVILVKKRHEILSYLTEDESKIRKFNYKQVLLTAPMIVFYVCIIFNTISGIEVIPNTVS